MRIPSALLFGYQRQLMGTLACGLAVILVAGGGVSARAAGVSDVRPYRGVPLAAVRALQERLPDAARVHSVALGEGLTRTRYSMRAARLQSLRTTWRADAREQARIDRHIDRLMRKGINVSSNAVDIVPLEIPNKVVFYLVQNKRLRLNDFMVDLTEKEGVDGFRLSFMTSHVDFGNDVNGESAGFDAGIGNSNITSVDDGARTIYFTPDYPTLNGKDHWVTHNWEKWRNNDHRRDWAYNAYATFDPAPGSNGWRGEMVDATIRSRPYQGYASRVTGGPSDYEPRPQEVCNSVATGNINVGPYGSLQIPYVQCYSGQEIYPNANAHSMGTAFYGRTTGQRFLDFAFEFEVANTTTTPIFSDYIWMALEYCWDPVFSCTGWGADEYNQWDDGGW